VSGCGPQGRPHVAHPHRAAREPREQRLSVLYQSEESVKILGKLITHKLFMSLFVLQILLGMFIPLGILIQLGIFSTRWNVVIGGQLLSKSFRG
jgi:uncharacterized membrane protein